MPIATSVNLLDALEEVGTVVLPPVGGQPPRERAVAPCTRGWMRRYRAFEAMPAGVEADEALAELVRLAVPGITEDELDAMTGAMMLVPVLQAQHKLDRVLAALERSRAKAAGAAEGNGPAPAAPRSPRRRRSRSTTASPTP